MGHKQMPQITRIGSNTKCDEVVQQVLGWIMHGIYKAGDRLPSESILAERFGVSRITIRESFKMLTMMGVVSVRQGEGTFVNKLDTSVLLKPLFSTLLFDAANINEIYEARIFVEMGTATLAARYRDDQDLQELADDISKMDVALKSLNPRAFTQYDHEFHYHIARISRNNVLLSTLATFVDLIKVYRQQSIHTLQHMQESHGRHHSIYNAIAAQDEELAAKLMKEHVNSCKIQVINSLNHNQDNDSQVNEPDSL